MAPIINFIIRNKFLIGSNTVNQLHQLDLQEDDLKITWPRGTYDPKID